MLGINPALQIEALNIRPVSTWPCFSYILNKLDARPKSSINIDASQIQTAKRKIYTKHRLYVS